jgi:Flp pilus assembly protein TadB
MPSMAVRSGRYIAKDALSSPSVPAVAQLQKVIEQTQKELAQKQQKKPQVTGWERISRFAAALARVAAWWL